MNLRIFPHHTGVWEGTYTRIAADGTVMWSHKSYILQHLEGNEWRQTNQYDFPSGKREFHNFGLSYFNQNGELTLDNYRIFGKSRESDKCIILWWEFKNEPDSKLFELINLIKKGHRTRVWQHTCNGVFEGITMIEEWKIAEQNTIDLSHFDQTSYINQAQFSI